MGERDHTVPATRSGAEVSIGLGIGAAVRGRPVERSAAVLEPQAMGSVRRAISVVKKRNGRHERTIRELNLGSQGVLIGEPLDAFRGILTGVPTYTGKGDDLTQKASNGR